MPHESTSRGSPWVERLGNMPISSREMALLAVLGAVIIGIHGIGHARFAAEVQPLMTVLWGLTTLMALGGLAGLGWTVVRLERRVSTAPHIDLEILPRDERTILEPILEHPGITQVEVVARSGYSDAKVSQTLKAIRERGLVYREPQGRTFRLYPGTIIRKNGDDS